LNKKNPLMIVILCLLLSACNVTGQSDEKPPLVDYCDLVAHPTRYDEKIVRVRATHITGFEWSFLVKENCCFFSSETAKTWIIIPGNATLCEDAKDVSTSTPSPAAVDDLDLEREVTVMGKFYNADFAVNGPYEYKFYMEFICLERAGKWR